MKTNDRKTIRDIEDFVMYIGIIDPFHVPHPGALLTVIISLLGRPDGLRRQVYIEHGSLIVC